MLCETDFVARNDQFQKLARDISSLVFTTGVTSVDALQQSKFSDGLSVADRLHETIAKMGENIVLHRCASLEAASPSSILCRYTISLFFLCSYEHNSVGPHMSQIAALVSFSVDGDASKLDRDALHKIGMHIVAASPAYLRREEIPAEILAGERRLVEEEVKRLNKPEKIAKKMAEGKLGEFYRQKVLVDQLFALDEKQGSVGKMVEKLGKQAGCKVAIEGFVRMQVGK